MTITTTIRFAAAGLIAAAAFSPVALAGGEPKNDWPFTRSVNDRSLAQLQQTGSEVLVAAGEAKNQMPFTRLVGVGRALLQAAQSTAAIRPDDRAGIRGVGSYEPATSAVRPDDRAGPLGATPAASTAVPDVFERAVQRANAKPLPDVFERAAMRGAQTQSLRPDDRAGPLGIGQVEVVPVSSGNGFDWGDWGIGLAAGFGVALVLAGALLLVTRRLPGRIGAAATR